MLYPQANTFPEGTSAKIAALPVDIETTDWEDSALRTRLGVHLNTKYNKWHQEFFGQSFKICLGLFIFWGLGVTVQKKVQRLHLAGSRQIFRKNFTVKCQIFGSW